LLGKIAHLCQYLIQAFNIYANHFFVANASKNAFNRTVETSFLSSEAC